MTATKTSISSIDDYKSLVWAVVRGESGAEPSVELLEECEKLPYEYQEDIETARKRLKAIEDLKSLAATNEEIEKLKQEIKPLPGDTPLSNYNNLGELVTAIRQYEIYNNPLILTPKHLELSGLRDKAVQIRANAIRILRSTADVKLHTELDKTFRKIAQLESEIAMRPESTLSEEKDCEELLRKLLAGFRPDGLTFAEIKEQKIAKTKRLKELRSPIMIAKLEKNRQANAQDRKEIQTLNEQIGFIEQKMLQVENMAWS